MFRSPRFKPHLHAEVVRGEGLFVISEAFQTVLQGRLYEIVAPCLDGRPIEDVCRQLTAYASAAEVFFTIRKLEENGYLCEAETALPFAESAWWSMQGIDPAIAARRLGETAVTLRGIGLDVAPLRSLLESLHVQLGDEGQFLVVATDSYLRRELQAQNEDALRSGRPWLLVKPVGVKLWIGPVFQPGKTGCWECLAERLRMNNPVLGYLDGVRGDCVHAAMGCSQTPASLSVAWGLVANAVAAWVVSGGESSQFSGKIQTLELAGGKTEWHTLVRQPSCSACGSGPIPLEQAMRPVDLQSRKKTYTEDGGHRSLTPQETLDKFGHHVSFICGAVSTLERSARVDGGVMHVYFSGNNLARCPHSLANLKAGLRNSTCGKGINDLQAKASALCEGLERYCGVYHGDEPRRLARMVDLGDAAIHPNSCMLFSERQYRERELRNARGSAYQFIPAPFDPQREIDWTPVWSLTRQAVRYLPTGFCYYYYFARNPQEEFCVGCSNGNAAGNCLEEAILQGFLELAERDAVGLWWYNRLRMPGVDFDGFNEPYLARLAAFFRSRGREFWALDLTTDLGIPAYTAISARVGHPDEHIMFGFGAHLDPRIALLRAVTELNQMLVHLLQTPDERIPPYLQDEDTLAWIRGARLADHPYLLPQEGPPRGYASYPHCWTDDLKEDILLCKSRVEQRGMEMLVLDQSRPETDMPVVKVIVPGLRHFWTRFAPGRLYDVPVKLGWIPRPTAEEDLNPAAMFI